MRTAVVRVDVDPVAVLSDDELAAGLKELATEAEAAGLELIEGAGRTVQLLVESDSADAAREAAEEICRSVFGTGSLAGVVTFVSRGTDDDAHGVLAGFGLTGTITRTETHEGWDVVEVELAAADLERVPESRIQTALEAALNCEVVIRETPG